MSTLATGMGWRSGMSSDVLFAPRISATLATPSTSTFFAAFRRMASSVSGPTDTVALATARRLPARLSGVSTSLAAPDSSM